MLLMMLQASGDPRMAQILTWISGSTYSATPERVVRSGAVMLALLALAPLCRRWLTILPLGGEAARAVGMALTSSRIVLLLLAACLTAAATLTIGPLSFVGLMAPHIARMMGFRRTLPHMATALCDLVARIRRNAPPPGKSLRHQAFKHLTAWQIPGARRRWCCRYLLRCGPRI